MAIISSGSVLQPQIVIVLLPFTSHLCLFATSWLSARPMHVVHGTLDLLMTDVPDLVPVAVVAPIRNSDRSSLSAVISLARAVPNLCARRKVFIKNQVDWNQVDLNTVCSAMKDLPWHNIC